MNNIWDVAHEPSFDWRARRMIGRVTNDRGNNSMTSVASTILAVGAAGKFARAYFGEPDAANAGEEA